MSQGKLNENLPTAKAVLGGGAPEDGAPCKKVSGLRVSGKGIFCEYYRRGGV